MIVLGISAFYHDSAAALVQDDEILAACEEERFSRIKHDNQFPTQSIATIFKIANITPSEIDAVVFYEKPLRKFERVLDGLVSSYPYSCSKFVDAIPDWLTTKLNLEKLVQNQLGVSKPIYYLPHHISHAATAYYTSLFPDATVVAIDGVGEYETCLLARATEGKITPLETMEFPHSLGLFYSTLTTYLGFRANYDEFKVMGLSAYGKPTMLKKLREIIEYDELGNFKLNLEYFNFYIGTTLYSQVLTDKLGPARKPNEIITTYHKDLAASLQRVTAEIYLSILKRALRLSNIPNLCVGGGVALNALANGQILANTDYKNVHIFGPSGDSGSAIGAALYLTSKNSPQRCIPSDHCSLDLGLAFSNTQIEQALRDQPDHVNFHLYTDEDVLLDKTTELLASGNVLGWFYGRFEFGPRALGRRSILAAPYPAKQKDRVNQIKNRESFRPFAASILITEFAHYFNVPESLKNAPYMNMCFKVNPTKKTQLAAVVHVDGTTRVQTVCRNDGRFFRLLNHYHRKTGVPALLNTSFNLKDEPLVSTPTEAVIGFLNSSLDYLIIGDYIVKKTTS